MFFIKYWRGEWPFLLSVFAVWLPASFVICLSAYFIGENFFGLQAFIHPIVLWIAAVSLCVGLSITCIWTSVGLWRCAGNYLKLNGSSYISLATGYFTDLINIAGVAYLVFTIAPVAALITKNVLLGYLLISPFGLRIASDGSEISINGGIRYGLSEKVESLLSINRGIETLALQSNGGDILEAEKLYHVISTHNLNTVVNDRCISECVLAFAGGKNRWLGLTGYLGFAPRTLFVPLTADVKEGAFELRKRYEDFGRSMDRLMATLFHKKIDVLYPSREDLLLFNYLTNKRSGAASSKAISDQFFARYIQEQKKSLPSREDEYTTLIDCEAREGQIRLIFLLSDEKFNAVKNSYFEYEILKEKIVSGACGNKKVKAGINAGVNYNFAYLKSSSQAESIEVEVDSCD